MGVSSRPMSSKPANNPSPVQTVRRAARDAGVDALLVTDPTEVG